MSSRSYLIRLGIFAVVVGTLLGAFAWQRVQYERLLDQRARDLEAVRKARVDSARYVSDTVEVQVAAASKLLERTVTRVRVDTIIVHPETRVDTVRALEQLPALAIAHDSLQRSCVSLAESCTAFRAAVARERLATDERIAGLERIAAAKQGHRWVGAPDLVYGIGACAPATGLAPCAFVGLGGRIGW